MAMLSGLKQLRLKVLLRKVPDKILIVKIGAIGDLVMSLPILTAIHKKYPQSKITWLCGSQAAPLLRAAQQINSILEVDEKKLLAGSFWLKLKHLFKTWKQIGFFKRFDLILTLHPDPRYRLLSFFCRCADRRHWGENRSRFIPIPGRYHAHEYLHLLNPEQTGPQELSIEFPVLHLPQQSETIPKIGETVIVLSPGGAKNVLADDALRRWPIQSYARLIEKLSTLENTHIVVTGSESDRWIESFLPKNTYHNQIGRFNLLEMISLLKKCSLLITHDSGPLHLAKLAGCPVLALFGPTNPHEKISPEENIKFIWGGERLSCRPCYNGKTYSACKRNHCLESISPELVFDTSMEMLSASKVAVDLPNSLG